MLKKLFNPILFQGNLKKKKYFEGWYFKMTDSAGDQVIALIPGISLGEDSHSFIQVICGSESKTAYYQFPLSSFAAFDDPFEIRIGKNRFSLDGMEIDLEGEAVSVSGKVQFVNPVPWKGRWFSPGIMGWYSFMPFMECYHGVVSLSHRLQGNLNVSGRQILMDGGFGYAEKDWGKSFPECWIWIQGNHYKKTEASVMFSVAKIPWLGKFFIGHISFFLYEGKVILFAEYNGSKIRKVSAHEKELIVFLESKEYSLELKVKKKDGGDLKAPSSGSMNRIIKEAVGAEIDTVLKDRNGKILFHDMTVSAGLEITGEILKHFE